MKTVVILASLVALALSGAVPTSEVTYTTETVDAAFVERQKKVLSLVRHVHQVDVDAEYYKIGKDYDIKANINDYTNKQAVEEFLALYKHGLLPKALVFSVFYVKMREEAVALFHLFYYAKDFDTFYKTAAFARIYVNEGQFLYAYYIAILHREDTSKFILPPVYEIYPQLFINSNVYNKINQVKMQDKLFAPELASQYGIVKESNNYVFYANYSNYLNYDNEEQRLSYFTEDIGLNTYYFYFHAQFPFWLEGRHFGTLKERRGEIVYFLYKRLLARYYMERLTNGLGEIPEFSWRIPFQIGYRPFLHSYYPFVQRPDSYHFVTEENFEDLRFLDAYEKNFVEFLEDGHFKAYNQEVDLHNTKAINFVSNYWQSNIDLYEKTQPRHYWRSYQEIARRVLSGTPKVTEPYNVVPSALDFYQTSLRDPAFYQLYSRITKYILKFKEYLEPYTQDYLHYVGVKITDVKVDPLVTYFDYFDFDVTNGVYVTTEQFKSFVHLYKVRQPRLNHKPFSVTVDVKSDVAAEAIVKVFLGPKYDSNGYPISLEDNWMNFLELDWFKYNLVQGENKIVRKSEEFLYFQEDWVSVPEVYKLLENNKVPKYDDLVHMPDRLMLPRGTKGGFPFQIFVIVYPAEPLPTELEAAKDYIKDPRPFSYPFDRPPKSIYFNQPNVYFEDVLIYHEGEKYTYLYNVPGYTPRKNEVPKN